MQKEEFMLQKRFIELSKMAYQRGIVTYSDFLNLNELNILHSIPRSELYCTYQTFGGYDLAERQMVAFLPDALYFTYEFPISIIKIRPLQKKFAQELNHRDFLGAILNLGIERCKIGDILVQENEAYLFACNTLETFITEELMRIKHTSVCCERNQLIDFHYEPTYREIKGSVSSLRLDSLLALAFSESRSKLVTYIESGRVFVNGKLITSNGYQIKENDIVSARGLGRFQFKEILGQTKKGRNMVMIYLYI